MADNNVMSTGDDANNQYLLCRKTFPNRATYENHIETVHNDALQEEIPLSIPTSTH